jgi:hypothetical protein
MCGAVPPTLYAFMFCTETASIAKITSRYFSFSNRQDRVSKIYCTFNCMYFPLRCNAVYSGKKNLTFRRNILLPFAGYSGEEGNRCLRNVSKSIPCHFILRRVAFVMVSIMMTNLIIILRILPTSLAMFIYDKHKN